MTASTVPTSTVSPSGTRISLSTPAWVAGTSVSTLSVDTSNSGSSSATDSPTCLNQRVIVPSVTDSPSWGITISAICAIPSMRSGPTAVPTPTEPFGPSDYLSRTCLVPRLSTPHAHPAGR